MELSKKLKYKKRIIWIVNAFADFAGYCAAYGRTFMPVFNTTTPGMVVRSNSEWFSLSH